MEYKFTFEGREYKLNEENLDYFVNDEENPIKNINLDKVLEIMANSDEVDFAKEYIFVKVLSKESETWAYSSWVHKEIKCENIVPVFENTK